MNSQPLPRTAAEHTAAVLQHAAQSGSPVLIPGALEPRARGPAARPIHRIDVPATVHAHAEAVSDRERLEHEREGGGAPSERAGARPATIRARLWRSMLHPTQVLDIWRRLLPQAH